MIIEVKNASFEQGSATVGVFGPGFVILNAHNLVMSKKEMPLFIEMLKSALEQSKEK